MALSREPVVYVAAAALRLALIVLFPALPDILTGRVEISSPVCSFKRCESTEIWHYNTLGISIVAIEPANAPPYRDV